MDCIKFIDEFLTEDQKSLLLVKQFIKKFCIVL